MLRTIRVIYNIQKCNTANLQKHSVEILAIGGVLFTALVAGHILIIYNVKGKILNTLKYVYTSPIVVKSYRNIQR